MSAGHHLEQIASPASFLRYLSLLHRNRVQNPNDWTSKARNESKLMMKVGVKRIVDAVVGEQNYSHCEMLDWMEAEEVAGSVQDRKTNYLMAL
jgi:hypothetical protein